MFLGGASGVVDRIVGGWQLNAIVTYQSGFPLSITQQVNNTNAFSLGQRPNVVARRRPGDLRGGEPSGSTATSTRRPSATAAANTFGNVAATIGVRSPYTTDCGSVGAQEHADLREPSGAVPARSGQRLEHSVFRAPNTQVGNPNFGRITSQANFARIIQLSVRLTW